MTLTGSSRQYLLDVLSDAGGGELIRESVRVVLQEPVRGRSRCGDRRGSL